jgi:hypothetical protein
MEILFNFNGLHECDSTVTASIALREATRGLWSSAAVGRGSAWR